jgi:asparagine synthase (glutamine-hydrolysing)
LLAVFRLFEGISRTGTKVVLEGQGADELLAGYYSGFAPSYALQLLHRMKVRSALSVMGHYFRTFGVLAFFTVLFRNLNVGWVNRLYFLISGAESLFAGPLKNYQPMPDSFYEHDVGEFECPFNDVLARSHSGVLLNLLHYGDSISMAFSIESRFPFLDHRLVEYVFSLPAEYKIRDGVGKYLHRKAMTSVLPEYVVESPLKLGFNAPFEVLFKDDEPGSIASVLVSSELAGRGLFDTGAIRVALNEVRAGNSRRLPYLFRIFLVELWFREFIDARGSGQRF